MTQGEPLQLPVKAKEVGRWESGYDGSPAPYMPLNNDTTFCGVPGFICKLSQL